MKLIRFLIYSNVYIALAAFVLTIASQVQFGEQPYVYPYVYLVFFSTVLEYNFIQFYSILTRSKLKQAYNHQWLNKQIMWYYVFIFLCFLGFLLSLVNIEYKLILVFMPLALITFLYSIPSPHLNKRFFKIRQIPYLKIFLISFVWSGITVLLPAIHSVNKLNNVHVFLIFIERFLFLFAITIPFDIRDMEDDIKDGIKTIPILKGKENSIQYSTLALVLFVIVSLIHYISLGNYGIASALTISFLSTLYVIKSEKIQNTPLYHYGILDGTMLLQGVLMLLL